MDDLVMRLKNYYKGFVGTNNENSKLAKLLKEAAERLDILEKEQPVRYADSILLVTAPSIEGIKRIELVERDSHWYSVYDLVED